MGAWGYEPKSSDSALDLFAGIDDVVDDALARLFGVRGRKPRKQIIDRNRRSAERTGSRTKRVRCGAWAARFHRAGIVQILLERGFFLKRVVVAQAVQDLTELLANTEVMEYFGWRNDGAAEHDITRIRNAMQALLADPQSSDTIYPNRGWPYLDPPRPKRRRSRRKPHPRAKRRRSATKR